FPDRPLQWRHPADCAVSDLFGSELVNDFWRAALRNLPVCLLRWFRPRHQREHRPDQSPAFCGSERRRGDHVAHQLIAMSPMPILSLARWVVLGLVGLAAAGCSSDPHRPYPVRGVIVFEDDQPAKELAGGSVSFSPLSAEPLGSSIGKIEED